MTLLWRQCTSCPEHIDELCFVERAVQEVAWLLEGVEFNTVVRAKTNTTESFSLGWPPDAFQEEDFQLEEALKQTEPVRPACSVGEVSGDDIF